MKTIILITILLLIKGFSFQESGQNLEDQQQIKNITNQQNHVIQNEEELQKLAQNYEKTLKFIIGEHHFQGFLEYVQNRLSRKHQPSSQYEIMQLINKRSHEFVRKQFDEIMNDYKLLMNSQKILETVEFVDLIGQYSLEVLQIREPEAISEDLQRLMPLIDLYYIVFGEKQMKSIIQNSYDDLMETFQNVKEKNNGIGDKREEFYDTSVFREGIAQNFMKNILDQLKNYGQQIKDVTINLQAFQKQVIAEINQQEQKLKQDNNSQSNNNNQKQQTISQEL